MFASFHSKGTIPSCSDMLNMCASGVQICCTVSFSILGAIPSTPDDLFSFILLILLADVIHGCCSEQSSPQHVWAVGKPHHPSRDC